MSANMCQISKMTYNHFNMLKDKKLKKIYILQHNIFIKNKKFIHNPRSAQNILYRTPFKIAHHYIHQRQETSQ